MLSDKDKFNAIVLYDVLTELYTPNKAENAVISKLYTTVDRLTDEVVNEMESIREKEEYKPLYESLLKELSKLA